MRDAGEPIGTPTIRHRSRTCTVAEMAWIALEELTWPAAEALRQHGRTVGLITDSALDGPGRASLPGTDFMVAEALARAVAEQLVPVIVTPALRAGLSDHHLTFPGTVSLSLETFRGWVDAHIAGLKR